jgi:hypothetical protein
MWYRTDIIQVDISVNLAKFSHESFAENLLYLVCNLFCLFRARGQMRKTHLVQRFRPTNHTTPDMCNW